MGGFSIVWSILQASNVETTAKGNKMSSKGDACITGDGYSQHKPLSFRFPNDDESLKCGWHTDWTIMRISTCSLIIIASLAILIGIFARKRWIMWFGNVPMLLITVVQIVMCIMDLFVVVKSYMWCTSDMPGVKRPPGDYKCTYELYWMTCGFDCILALLCVIAQIAVWLYTLKWWNRRYSAPALEERQSLVTDHVRPPPNKRRTQSSILDTPNDEGYSPTSLYTATKITESAYQNKSAMQSNYAI
jgi:hypothetical protein